MVRIIKYRAENGEEFNTRLEAIDYEESIVDKNGCRIRLGDWIKESWHFHGFNSDGLGGMVEVINKDKCFRFFRYDYSMRLDINRVKHLGWPVSGYEIEIIPNEEKLEIENSDKYKFDDYYKCYRVKENN